MKSNLIIYDGECGFCNKIILFIAQKDTKNNFVFVSNLSKTGQDLLSKFNLAEASKTSIVVIKNDQSFIKSKAIKIIFSEIEINKLLQKTIRFTNSKIVNFVYSIIANNRLLLFSNVCKIPPREMLSKFITI